VQDLERAVEAPEIVRALTAYGLTQQEVGTIAGVSDRAVRQWRRAGIKQDRYDRLIEVREIALLLSDSLSPRGVGQWLHAKNRLLHGELAIDLLAHVLPAGLDENGSASFAEDVSACLHADAKRRRLMTAVTDRRAPKCFL